MVCVYTQPAATDSGCLSSYHYCPSPSVNRKLSPAPLTSQHAPVYRLSVTQQGQKAADVGHMFSAGIRRPYRKHKGDAPPPAAAGARSVLKGRLHGLLI